MNFLNHVNHKGQYGDEQDRGLASPTTVCFEHHATPTSQKRKIGQVDDNNTSSHVGKFVAVYWPDDDVYYRGKITRKRKSGAFFVKYEDGDSEWVDPDTTVFQELKHKNDNLPPRKVSPSLEMVTLGSRLLVWWPAEEQYYEATVAMIKPTSPTPFKLHYDDGDREWTDLANRNFVFQE